MTPFDRELWKHSAPQSFEQQAQQTEPPPVQNVLTVSVSCATIAKLALPKKKPRKTKPASK